MRTEPALCVVCLLMLSGATVTAGAHAAGADGFADVRGAYLGQDPPGTTPVVFAPGLISTEKSEGGVVAYPGGNEIYFWVVEPVAGSRKPKVTIYVTRAREGRWSRPEVASFSGVHLDGYPAVHPDGSRLYFQSDRPIDPAESTFEYNIWYVERRGDGWSEARSIGRPINGRNCTGGPSVTRDGTLYFSLMDMESGVHRLYRAELVDGAYAEPEQLPEAVNFAGQTVDSYIAPDESYLVFNAFPAAGHAGNPGKVCVAHRDPDGTWRDVASLGPLIGMRDEPGTVTISPDGRFVFLTRDDPRTPQTGPDVFWVDAAVLADR